jgi:hypothetical protein
MFAFLASTLIRTLLLAVLGVGAAHPAVTTSQAAPAMHTAAKTVAAKTVAAKTVAAKTVAAKTVAAKTVTAPTACDTALAYLHAHGNPTFSMRCEPGALPNGLAAVTCWKGTGLGVSCLTGGIVVISQPSCAISYENEASNSWLDFSTLTSGAINGHNRHDASGRIVDPFGECG